GVTRIQQADGTVQYYPDSRITFRKDDRTLKVTSADGKGSMILEQAACSYVNALYRCFLTQVSYMGANGQEHPIDFERGTAYANVTSDRLTLPFSSQTVPPDGILISMKTKRGTYISVTGTVDKGLR
ncbi:MAG TPA: hypothetical protein VGP41_16020, partial [Candidatus Lustribacter sp.]|nr:hypothetical protein [Candidatus Lustribacter sp.]